jgi:polyhydroxybutyrate depolymerase
MVVDLWVIDFLPLQKVVRVSEKPKMLIIQQVMIYCIKNLFVPGILFLLPLSDIFGQDTDGSKHIFTVDGRDRIYYMHIPENISEKAPLVFVFHGYGGNAKNMIGYSGMNPIADKNGFAVCYPQGVFGEDEKNSWNAGYSNPDVDDVKFITSLARFLHEEYNLDPENTFATGMSNGADICYVLACRAPEVFSAFAPVAGCMMESTFNTCNPRKPRPVFETHGTDDDITLWNGDKDYSEIYGGYKGVRETFDFWVKLNKCPTVKRDVLTDLNKEDKSFVVREIYTDGVEGNEVWLYTLVGGKHDWPGSWGNKDFMASEEIWNFFKRFVRD